MRNNKVKFIILILLFIILAVVLYVNFFKPVEVKKETMEIIPTTGEIIKAELYFSSQDGMFLATENREIPKAKVINNQIKIVLLELINGPKDTSLVPTIPVGTKIHDVYIDQYNVLYVDFSKEIKENHIGGSTAEILTVYSIVNTLTTNFPEIKQVQILIDGNTIDSLAGHIDISEPVKPDFSIVQILQKW